ncbi:NAD(P)-dependent dehydrogenase (short-subunit alcohol dehydrogenase family) [Mesorhizobium sp. USDA 4775]|uniref:SDR family oxidoreductase n=1 Tax=Mesorhizobium jarvisii TaxID=1777867 RepID=UPI00037C978C|nr:MULTISPECIES: SDR family oxidoreductase [Mesorhizobium]AID32400.1 SDR family NAD(P)-dependent oxidoreductase [Mesorhizobium huakuii 7653R]ANN56975.1 short-chain dehydrogenase/reductase [Mesorhizobium loti NZP2037]MCH4555134.1 SDR family oxidoreductase [Mesorhizobium jarvisii]
MTKTVLITGCSSGLGKTTARHFAAQGWNVIATMRKPDQSLAAGYPEQMLVLPLDVTNPASIESAIAAGIARFGHIDTVVNNAGISVVSIFEATAKATIRGIFETNVFGVMNVMQAVIPHLRDHGGGTIVNITSGVGLAAVPLLALYTATKHAVEGLSESLSYELESQNILVKLVEPGAMRTTSFTANTMEASQAVSVPAKYKPYFDHMMRSMMNYPLPDADEEQVVATIHAAATDPSNRLRYLAGPDTEEMARLRWSTSEDEYLSTMNRLMGQTAWRDGNPG